MSQDSTSILSTYCSLRTSFGMTIFIHTFFEALLSGNLIGGVVGAGAAKTRRPTPFA